MVPRNRKRSGAYSSSQRRRFHDTACQREPTGPPVCTTRIACGFPQPSIRQTQQGLSRVAGEKGFLLVEVFSPLLTSQTHTTIQAVGNDTAIRARQDGLS